MTFQPNNEDYAALDQFLELVLERYKLGEIDRDKAVGALAHTISVAAIDNAGEFKAYIRLSEAKLFED